MQLLSGRQAQKTKNESRKLSMYSKQWLPGDTLHTFYPIFWQDGKPDFAVGAVWGHQVSDIKGLGLKTSFIPSTTEFDKDGVPVGQPDITYQFSMIAKVFVEGQKAIEEEAIQNKKFPNEALRKEALKDLETKYDAKNNMEAVQPIIKRASFVISTEVVSVKMANGAPVLDTVAHTNAPLSNELLDQLYNLLDNPKYAPAEGDKFFEVEWSYVPDPKKSQSGRKSKPAGLTPEYRIPNQFPDAWKTIQGIMTNVSMDSETIVRRSTRSVDPAKVRAAVSQYAYMHSEALDAANEDGIEILLRNAQLLKDLSIPQTLNNVELQAKIESELRKAAEASIPASGEALPNMDVSSQTPIQQATYEQAATPAPTMEQPVQQAAPTMPTPGNMAVDDDVLSQMAQAGAAAGAPSLQSLMNSPYNMGTNTDALEGIDTDYV